MVLRSGRKLARLEDLGSLRLVLRRPGTGTRLLFDRTVPRNLVRRVAGEVQTHAEVAAAVLRGEADAGTATRATAVRYGLGFFPLLRQAVIRDENVFEVLMDAVRVCSLGQITHALFEVGGQYRRSM